MVKIVSQQFLRHYFRIEIKDYCSPIHRHQVEVVVAGATMDLPPAELYPRLEAISVV